MKTRLILQFLALRGVVTKCAEPAFHAPQRHTALAVQSQAASLAVGTIQRTRRRVSRRDPLPVTIAMCWEGRCRCAYHAWWPRRAGQSAQMMCGEAPCMDFVYL